MQCSFCSSPMTTIDHAGITLDECSNCGALWFDRTEFAATMKHDVPGVSIQWGKSVESHGPAHACLRDGMTMKPMTWDGIPFFRCPACAGVLLSKASWEAAHTAAEARSSGTRFSPIEIMRDVFNM